MMFNGIPRLHLPRLGKLSCLLDTLPVVFVCMDISEDIYRAREGWGYEWLLLW